MSKRAPTYIDIAQIDLAITLEWMKVSVHLDTGLGIRLRVLKSHPLSNA